MSRLGSFHRILLAAGVFLLLLLSQVLSPGPSRLEGPPDVLFVSVAANADGHGAGPWIYPPGARLFRLVRSPSAVQTVALVPDLELLSPPALSYDGQSVLLAARTRPSAVAQIWEMELDGGSPQALTASDFESLHPLYLPDGRVVFSRRIGASPPGAHPVYSLFTAGPGAERAERITFGNSRDRALAVLADGRLCYERSLNQGLEGLALSMTMAISPDGTGLARYAGPLLSSSLGEWAVVSLRVEEDGDYALFEAGSSRSSRLIFRRPGFHLLDPILIRARTRPPVPTSVVDASQTRGWLLGLNASVAALPEEPFPQSLAELRVLDRSTGEILGVAPIESDGSFFLEIPADRWIGLHGLDQGGSVVARLDSGIWVRPNEHRGCVGCHWPANLAPDNRFPEAVTKPPLVMGVDSVERVEMGPAREERP